MSNNKNKGVALAVLSLFCGAAVLGGVFAGNNVKANAADAALYERDFESLSVTATPDEIYGATYVAGANRSVVAAEKDYIEAVYTFWDNGCQHTSLYLNSGRVPSTDVDKVYTFELEFENFGEHVKNMILGLTGPDTALYNSVVQFNADGTSFASNYASADFVTLKSAERDANGWWKAVIEIKGTGGYIFPNFFMNIDGSKYEAVNAALDTGLRLAQFKVTEGENTIYDLASIMQPGLNGEPAVFGATGFAGGTSIASKAGAGIDGKSVKAVYTFWDNGWQHEPLYINEGAVNARMEEGKQYIVEMDVEGFGNVNQVYCIFNQVGIADSTDSQVILNSDGSYQTAEYGLQMFDSIDVDRTGSTYHIKATINGHGGLLKFFFNMHSSDYEDSNTNMNTGLYLDNVKIVEKSAEGDEPSDEESKYPNEWKNTYTQNFNSVSPSLVGGEAFYHATGFAGVGGGSLTVGDGIDGSQCAKAAFLFWEDGGWQKEPIYLDSGRTSNTLSDTMYKASMKIKPFGDWGQVAVGFSVPTGQTGYIFLNRDGSFGLDKVGALFDAEVTYEDGVFTVTAYLMGTDSWIFNFINMQANDPVSANANFDTGIYLDDYSFAKEVKPEPAGLNKKAAYYNKVTDGDFVTMTTFANVESVMIGDTALSASDYSFVDGKLTIAEAALNAFADGTYTVTVAAGSDSAEMQLVIANVPVGSVYTNDFAGMPDLMGDQDAKDNFFRNSYFDPAVFNVWTVDEGDNRMIKFVAPEASDAFLGLFQTNPQSERLNVLTKNKLHTVYFDLKPENGTVITIDGRVFDNGADEPYFYMELDLAANKRVDTGIQSADTSWNITAKDNGWYTVSISFIYDGNWSDTASMYIRFFASAAQQDVWYFDNFDVQSELIPALVSEKNTYDIAAGTVPNYIVDLCGAFDIESILVNGNALTANDYAVEVTPVGYTRIDLAKAYCENYNLGDEVTVVIKTTKGNDIVSKFTVIDSRPTLEVDVFDYDKAVAENLAVAVDLKGYEIASISLGETALIGTEYNFNAASGVMDFKGVYLATLSVGEHVFTVKSSSGASCQFTITIADSTPVFGAVSSYEKSVGGDFVVDVELNGKAIVSVSLGETVLTADQYSYAEGKLSIKASVMESLVAGKYSLKVETIASATVEVNVNDAPPVFSGEYTATQGTDLVITVETYNKKIVSVKIDDLALLADEYAYENGKLTIKGSVFEEVAAGERQLILLTEGGESTLTFTLQAKVADEPAENSSGCFGMLGATVPAVALGAAAVVLSKKNKKED